MKQILIFSAKVTSLDGTETLAYLIHDNWLEACEHMIIGFGKTNCEYEDCWHFLSIKKKFADTIRHYPLLENNNTGLFSIEDHPEACKQVLMVISNHFNRGNN